MKIDPTQKLSQRKSLTYCSCFLYGLLGAAMAMIINHFTFPPMPNMGTVNITGLVDRFIKTETVKHLPSDVLRHEIELFSHDLERELKLFSTKNHMVLLPSEAVIAGAQDYTVVIKEHLNQGR